MDISRIKIFSPHLLWQKSQDDFMEVMTTEKRQEFHVLITISHLVKAGPGVVVTLKGLGQKSNR